jgi:hypothetical protein
MLRLFLLLALLASLNTSTGLAQTEGDSEETILRVLGEPNMKREVGERKIWMYPDGTKVVLEAGVVVESTAPSTGARNTPSRRALESERPSRERQDSTARSSQSQGTRTRQHLTADTNSHSGAGLFFLVVGILVIVVCHVIFIIAAFTESILWGLGVLFVPLVSLVFLFLHWDQVKKPFLVSILVGAPMVVLSAILSAMASGA